MSKPGELRNQLLQPLSVRASPGLVQADHSLQTPKHSVDTIGSTCSLWCKKDCSKHLCRSKCCAVKLGCARWQERCRWPLLCHALRRTQPAQPGLISLRQAPQEYTAEQQRVELPHPVQAQQDSEGAAPERTRSRSTSASILCNARGQARQKREYAGLAARGSQMRIVCSVMAVVRRRAGGAGGTKHHCCRTQIFSCATPEQAVSATCEHRGARTRGMAYYKSTGVIQMLQFSIPLAAVLGDSVFGNSLLQAGKDDREAL